MSDQFHELFGSIEVLIVIADQNIVDPETSQVRWGTLGHLGNFYASAFLLWQLLRAVGLKRFNRDAHKGMLATLGSLGLGLFGLGFLLVLSGYLHPAHAQAQKHRRTQYRTQHGTLLCCTRQL